MTKQRILLLGKLPPPYMGPAIATKIILESDLCKRYDVSFLNTKANDSISTLGKWSFGKILKNFSLYFELISLIVKNKPDVILIPISQTTSGFIKDSIYILIASVFRKRILLQLRGSDFKNWIDRSSSPVKSYVRFILKRSKGIIVLGEKLKYLFQDYFSNDNIFVVPNGADYNFPERTKHPDQVKILYLSNLLSSKGIDDVFMAIHLLQENLKQNNQDISFSVDFIGEWLHQETKEYCLNLKEKYQLPVRIHTSEASKDKFNYLSDADIFVFPPREPEGHPWSIVEAMAAGLPVISTDKGAITESVVDGLNGFIVEPKHPEQIAQKLQTLLADKNLREAMGKESRNLYLNKFTEAKMVENLSNAFERVIERK